MKIRTDFVTNSSSASYVVEFKLRSVGGQTATYLISTDAYPEEYEGQSPYQVLFKWGWPIKALDLWFPYYPKDGSLDDLIASLLGCVEVKPYPEGIILDTMRFFIVGEPLRYKSREKLEDVIRRNAGKVVGPYEADFVILCGEGKRRFCERWPFGYSLDEMDDAELDELYEAEEAIDDEIQKALRAAVGPGDPIVWGLYTGSREQREYEGRDDWQGWTVNDWHGDPLPVLSEEEFAFFDPNGPAGDGALSAMPGAVEAFARKCAENGITRENLYTIGARFNVCPFGDSWWEVEPRQYQWCINVQTKQEGSIDTWDWQDTVWWPLADDDQT